MTLHHAHATAGFSDSSISPVLADPATGAVPDLLMGVVPAAVGGDTVHPVPPAAEAAPGAAGLAGMLAGLRVGEGWDCHALVPGRALVLGGVAIPHSHGLLGHSDADVLLHAVTDAVLGAAGLGDIGHHFPDTDARFRGADSRALLAEAMCRVRAAGFELLNVDSTVVAQAPKLAPHIPAMVQGLAVALGVLAAQVNIKAKTAERLGPVGQGLSMEARAVALLWRPPAVNAG